jgi:hypothetical protein
MMVFSKIVHCMFDFPSSGKSIRNFIHPLTGIGDHQKMILMSDLDRME